MKRRYFITSIFGLFPISKIKSGDDDVGIHTMTIQPPEVNGIMPPPLCIRVDPSTNYRIAYENTLRN